MSSYTQLILTIFFIFSFFWGGWGGEGGGVGWEGWGNWICVLENRCSFILSIAITKENMASARAIHYVLSIMYNNLVQYLLWQKLFGLFDHSSFLDVFLHSFFGNRGDFGEFLASKVFAQQNELYLMKFLGNWRSMELMCISVWTGTLGWNMKNFWFSQFLLSWLLVTFAAYLLIILGFQSSYSWFTRISMNFK